MKKVITLIAALSFVASCSPQKSANPNSSTIPINNSPTIPDNGGAKAPDAAAPKQPKVPVVTNPSTAHQPEGPIVAPHDPPRTPTKFSRVIYVIFENEDQKQVISNAYFKSLADKGANFTNMKAESHPSQGNYIAMVAGDTLGVQGDGNIDLNAPNIADLLENKNRTWKTYAEGYPGNCFKGSRSGKYARKHVPLISFVNITNSASRCSNIVNEKNFISDWKTGKLPNYSIYIPDLNNDGHDTSIDFAANYVKKTFDAAFNDPTMMKDTLVILTYDESSYSGDNKIYNVFLGPMIKPGSVVTASHSHYSLLKMIEDDWGLGSLNRNDATSQPITGIWK